MSLVSNPAVAVAGARSSRWLALPVPMLVLGRFSVALAAETGEPRPARDPSRLRHHGQWRGR